MPTLWRTLPPDGVELFLYDAVQEGIEVPPRPSEDWARGLRYGWFDELAAREEAVIATAHTMSDQAETVLFRMARGTGLHGLTGIPPRRGCYVRPCLCLTRADTEAYCAALGQHYIRDETNDQDVYARNRIRHDAIPALQYANPAAERSIARLCRQMRALDDWLTGEAAALLQAATVPGGYDVTVSAPRRGTCAGRRAARAGQPRARRRGKVYQPAALPCFKGGGCCSADPGRKL